MAVITDLQAREILDSRGMPTLEVDVLLADNAMGRAAVPSGASCGSHEAVEKRDGDLSRFNGKGVLSAVTVVEQELKPILLGMDAAQQTVIDHLLIQTDGTPDKHRLGANTLLGVSLAVAKAAAQSVGLPLYRYWGSGESSLLPVPLMNILNGGKHADNNLACQEFMIVPVGAPSCREAIRMGSEVFQALKSCLKQAGLATGIGDEGGFAPALSTTEEALDTILKAITTAGYRAGKDIVLALDMAANEFFQDKKYKLSKPNQVFSAEQLVDYYENLIRQYPIFSIEDGLAEDDWSGWQLLTRRLGQKIQLVGDDLFVTNPQRLEQGIHQDIANAVLIKPNQIGTLTETFETVQMAQKAHYRTIISHRSGETEDTAIADLAVATCSGQIKAGSLSRTDRLAKYNQLIRIEESLGPEARFAGKSILISELSYA